jgi:hypothetical protein
MRPRTQQERRVTELSATLRDLRPIDEEWIVSDFKVNRKKYKWSLGYYLVMERCKEWQVIRYYYRSYKRLFEFMQVWINADGERIIRAKKRFMRVDGWVETSEMSIWKQHKYMAYSYLGGFERLGWSGLKIRSLLPELKKRGLRTSSHDINPTNLCEALLKNNRLETLFKLRQYRLVHEFADNGYYTMTDTIWQAIRVALRHGYHWDNHEEFDSWYKMVRDLEFLGLDTRNPHYICPANLIEAHTHWMLKREDKDRYEEYLHDLQKAKEYEETFHENRKQFLDMTFAKGRVTISIIPTAAAIVEEGRAMHHCVGGYYNQTNSLILSAKVDGKRMETIEVDLKDYTIVQSRGLQNKYTSFHATIVSLLKKNLKVIKERNQQRKAA